MRHTLVVIACLLVLSGCSKSNDATADKDKSPPAADASDAPTPPTADEAKAAALAAAFTNAVKVDVAALVVASPSEACSGMKGQDMPDPKLGAPIQFTPAGVISWGKGSLDYVKEPGAIVVFTGNRAEKTFAFGADIYELPQGNRKYVAGLSQLRGGSLSATVTDETKAQEDSKQSVSQLCVGSGTPALATQGAWVVAAKHLQVAATTMSCTPMGKLEMQDIVFSFDGKTIQAGANSFTQADSGTGETLNVDHKGSSASVVYSLAKADGTGVGLGMSQAKTLSYATVDLPGGVHLLCSGK